MKEKSLLERIISNPLIQALVIYVSGGWIVLEMTDYFINNYGLNEEVRDILLIILLVGLPVAIFLAWIIQRKKQTSTFDEIAIEETTTGKEKKKEQHNLPAQLNNFIGRKKEIQIIKELISKHRIVSLTGAGGCGKTRLACEIGAEVINDFKDGIWFVDLSPISDEDLVAKEITEALTITEIPNQQVLDLLIEKIMLKKLLIILDNCEHLVNSCAEVTGKLIKSVPGLKMLITSREALNITGEKVWRVPSLNLLDPKTIINIESAKSSDAVLLFCDRAQMRDTEFQLETSNVNEVVSICNKLDGIPLALELVASRTRHLNTQMILERFSDSFDKMPASDPGISKRQKTLSSTIEWSYDLLSDSEKLLFARLAVFSGGFDLAAAENICSDDKLQENDILEVLSRLIDKSLVNTLKGADQYTRYNRQETIRHFALQKLKNGNEEDSIRKKHLQYYLELAETGYKNQLESQMKWLRKTELEHDNLMGALNWSGINSGEDFDKLAGYLSWFWIRHSHIKTGRKYLEKALSKSYINPEDNARLLFGLGCVYLYMDQEKALKLMNQSLDFWREQKNKWEETYVLSTYSASLVSLGKLENGLKGCEQSLEIARDLDQPGLINHCLATICQAYVHSKNFEKGKPLAEELLISSEKLQQPWSIIAGHHFYSDCFMGIGDFKEAERQYGYAFENALKYESYFQATVELQGIAMAISAQSRWPKTVILDAAITEKFKELGANVRGLAKFWDEWYDIYIEGAKKELGEELTRKYEEEGKAMGFDRAVEYALNFEKD